MMRRNREYDAEQALCMLANNVREWLEDWEFLIGPAASDELHEILDEA